jgi:lysophospholipase L1-like esterase
MAKNNKTDLELTAVKNYLLPYLNLHKHHPFLPGAKNIKGQAAFIGLQEQELADYRQMYSKNARIAALDLLKREDVIEFVHGLPFQTEDTILVIGDSITDDMQGWFEIFRHVLEIGVDNAAFRLKNEAVYGSTSVDALRRIDRDLDIHKPDWVIIALGSVDAQRFHGTGDRTLVSLAEFYENITTMESMVTEVTQNPVIWVTPPPAIKELMQDMPLFSGLSHEADLAGYREVISGKSGYVADPYGKRMGTPPHAWNYMPDGFHPSVAGHCETVVSLLRTLAVTGRKTN